jgi:hypothetical protein
MSIPESDSGSLHSVKKSALNILGRKISRKKKGQKGQKLMQLPDSAVAAKTLGGYRHIAISIPIEHDHLDHDRPVCPLPTRSGSFKPSSGPGAVTIMKPVEEVRESNSSHRSSPPRNSDGKRNSVRPYDGSFVTPAAELLGPETARTLENYYNQLHRQQKLKAQATQAAKPGDGSRSQRNSYVAIPSSDVKRQDSQCTDPRHSGGTVYSAASISTPRGHFGGDSNVPTAPSTTAISGLRLELPTRSSSISKIPKSILEELAQGPSSVNDTSREKRPASSLISEHSLVSSPVIGTAETAKGYSATAGIQKTRSHTPDILSPTPAPTRDLPDVPESPCIPAFLPSPSPPLGRKVSQSKASSVTITKDVAVCNDFETQSKSVKRTDQPVPATLQNRQERVKARKARDVAALREKRITREPLSDAASVANINHATTSTAHSGATPSSTARPTPSPGPTEERRLSRERLLRRSQNSLSAIMLVADLAPNLSTSKSQSPPKQRLRKRISDSNSTSLSAKGTPTPPRSFVSSINSDSDTFPDCARSAVSSPRSISRSGLDVRRQERKAKRNATLQERDMEARLAKVERDNAMFLSTLTGIANSFTELHRLMPQRRRGEAQSAEKELRTGPEGTILEVQRLEPVMRELQAGAGRISMEESSSRRGELEDEDDGASIL